MIRSLALVVPPQVGLLEGFSSGAVSLANYVQQKEPAIQVRLLDLSRASAQQLRSTAEAYLEMAEPPLLVGVTTTTASYQAALAVARAFKEHAPGCAVVLGGHHAAEQDEVVLRHHPQLVDFVVRGEGEKALLELVRAFPSVSEVRSLTYRSENGVTRNPPAPLLQTDDLDKLGPIFVGNGRQAARGKFERMTYVSARGCPLRCSFCAVANQTIRAKCIKRVVEDIRFLATDLGYKYLAIEDNFFAHSVKRTVDLCNALAKLREESRVAFAWDCQTRVESMRSPKVLDAMERAGCDAVYLGVEALVPRQLRYLGKTTRPDAYLQLLKEDVVPRLLQSKVACYLNLQLAVPGTTSAEEKATINSLGELGALAVKMGKTITLFPMLHVVYPGTAHFHEAVRERRFGPASEDVFESFTLWEAEQKPVLSWLGEHFAHGAGGIPEAILDRERLRRGVFRIDADAVLRSVNVLDRIEVLAGIEVFRYGAYLASEACA